MIFVYNIELSIHHHLKSERSLYMRDYYQYCCRYFLLSGDSFDMNWIGSNLSSFLFFLYSLLFGGMAILILFDESFLIGVSCALLAQLFDRMLCSEGMEGISY